MSKKAATPMSIEVFGERGVFQSKRGPAPPTIEAFGEHGVLQAEPGPPSAAALMQRFIEIHDDARVLPSGKVLCTTTGHEMPAKINDVQGHWGGRRYRQACGGARRVRRSPGGGSPAAAAAGTTTREAARSGGKVVKRTKKSRPPTSPQVGCALDPATIQPAHTTHHTPHTTHHTRTSAGFSPAPTVASPAAGRGVDRGRRGKQLFGRLLVATSPCGRESRGARGDDATALEAHQGGAAAHAGAGAGAGAGGEGG
jgi:hypothetical protein